MIILVKAGAPVDQTIASLAEHMEKGDIIIDGGNEWYENTERRQKEMEAKGIYEIGMGVSGGEEGARRGKRMLFFCWLGVYFYEIAPNANTIDNVLIRDTTGPAMMPGGSAEAYKYLQPIVDKVAAQTDDGPCVTYIGEGGAGEYSI